jgi:hypothetical protein
MTETNDNEEYLKAYVERHNARLPDGGNILSRLNWKDGCKARIVLSAAIDAYHPKHARFKGVWSSGNDAWTYVWPNKPEADMPNVREIYLPSVKVFERGIEVVKVSHNLDEHIRDETEERINRVANVLAERVKKLSSGILMGAFELLRLGRESQ